MELVLMIVVMGVVAALALTAVARDLRRANRERKARAAGARDPGATKRQ
jgi:type II secretory pathway pseudopilin PulG